MDEKQPSAEDPGRREEENQSGIQPAEPAPPVFAQPPPEPEKPVPPADTPAPPAPALYRSHFWRILLLSLLGLLILFYSVNKVANFDVWWHLKTGEYFLSGGSFGGEEPFAFTTPDEGHRWIEIHWFFQMILAFMHRIGGFNLLILMKAGFLLAAFSLMYRLAAGSRSPILAPALFGLAILAGAERFIIRPEIASYLFVALFIVILEKYRRDQKLSRLVWLVVLQLLWVNTQGLFALGPVIIGCFLVGEFIRWRIDLPYHWIADAPVRDRAYALLLVACAVCLLVCLLNPWGIHGALFPLEQFQMIQGDQNIFRQTILEFDRPFSDRLPQDNPATRALALMMGISILSFLLTFRRWDITRVALFAAFLFLGLSARRNMALFSLVAAPLSVLNFRDWISAWPPAGRWADLRTRLVRWRPLAAATVGLFLVFGLYLAGSDEYFIKTVGGPKFGMGVKDDAYPRAAVELIESENLEGPIYNELGYGGYLIYQLHPRHKVFIDGRNEVFGAEFYSRYIDTLVYPEKWYDLAREYDLQLALLNVRVPIDDRLIQTLHRDPEWALIQHDGTSALFARRSPQNQKMIDVLEQDPATMTELPAGILPTAESRRTIFGRLHPEAEIYLGMFYLKLGNLNLAKSALEQAVSLKDSLISTRFYLGEIYGQEGDLDRALESYQRVAKEEPRMGIAYERIGSVYHRSGRIEQAVANYQRAVERKFDSDMLRTNLGDCYLQMGLPQKAMVEFEAALVFSPDNPNMRYNVGFVHQLLGERAIDEGDDARADEEISRAVEVYERILEEIDPQHFRSLYNLAMLYITRDQLTEARRCLLSFLASPEIEEDQRRNGEQYLAEVERVLAEDGVPLAGPMVTEGSE